MTLESRLNALCALGDEIRTNLETNGYLETMFRAEQSNPWFTIENQKLSLQGIAKFIERSALEKWLSTYQLPSKKATVGIVMAGNIPLVGFHDLLSVLVCGHHAQVKVSSKDSILIKFLFGELFKLAPEMESSIEWTEKLEGYDAIIATGSDNSARYFHSYFGKVPNIIRKNRVSCSVLTGEESEDELSGLANDIFQYFGLGCRSVSKLYVPEGYDLGKLDEPFSRYKHLEEHNKYANNYLYNRSILLMNSKKFRENGFMIMQETSELTSPVSVVYYEFYPDTDYLIKKLKRESDKLQCIVANNLPSVSTVEFGQTQRPGLSDYADNVDTMKFLCEL